LREFLDRYPLLDLQIGQGDRLVDLVREGVDCVIRSGEVEDSGLIVRKLGEITEITCASPRYIADYGKPLKPEDLEHHRSIGFLSSRTGQVMPLELTIDGEVRYFEMRSRLTVNNSDTMAELARLGFGLIQAPRYRLQQDLTDGTLVEVLADYMPPPTRLSALYPQNRHTAPRLRVFLDWISQIFREADL
jgi:DNA-binding transcriptional LysR family regulator